MKAIRIPLLPHAEACPLDVHFLLMWARGVSSLDSKDTGGRWDGELSGPPLERILYEPLISSE